jgi:hypothetical protein
VPGGDSITQSRAVAGGAVANPQGVMRPEAVQATRGTAQPCELR